MRSKYLTHIQRALLALTLCPLLSHANEADKPVVTDPHAQHHDATPQTPPAAATVTAPAPTKPEAEAPKTEESSSKGLVVHRAPDFCMKKDPPPHCSE
jgi:hypothetical protein